LIQLKSIPDSIFYQFRLEKTNGECDLFVSASHYPSRLDHQFYNVDHGDLDFVLEASCFDTFIYIAVADHMTSCQAKLQVKAIRKEDITPEFQAKFQEAPLLKNDAYDPATYTRCKNCNAPVPIASLDRHEAFCIRNNTPCGKCQKAFNKEEFKNHYHCDKCDFNGPIMKKSKHEFWFHKPFECTCSEMIYIHNVKDHKTTCQDRLIICRFCHTSVRAGPLSRLAKDLLIGSNFSQHESECGARTITCQKCGRLVQLKDIQTHALFHKVSAEKPIDWCKNKQCCNKQSAQYPNRMNMCPECFADFWTPRVETEQKRVQKILVKYHTSLTRGCGNDLCDNIYCANTKGPMDPNEAAALALELMKTPFNFCVKRSTSIKKSQAKQLSEMGFEIETCYEALDKTNSFQEATNWLLKI
jgi:hypothetical protein